MKYLARKLSTFASLFIIVQRKYSPFIKKTKRLRKQIALLAGAFLIFGGPAMILSLINTKQANAWFDNNWAYRRTVPVSSHQSSEKNVYIVVTLDTSDTTKFKSDCSDLRFTNQNGTLLPYIISSGCNTESTIIHIMLEDFPKGEQTIYYYYGNPSAKPLSSVSPFPNEATNYTIGTLGNEENGDAPISYWKFDEGTGTTANDSGSKKNSGTISGATWSTQDQCIKGKCLSFDGINDSVSYGTNNPNFKFGKKSFTISAWIKGTITGTSALSPAIFGVTQSNTSSRYALSVYQNTGKVKYSIFDDSSNSVDSDIENINVLDNKWHYVAMVVDRDNNILNVYIDGMKATDNISLANVTGDVSPQGSAVSGARVFGDQSHFQGKIDEIKIYPYARSQNQIIAGLNQGSTVVLGLNSNPALSNGLVGYWKMDEESWNGTSGEVKDSSGNGNNATANTVNKTSSGGNTSTTINTTTNGWRTNQFAGASITITSGTNAGDTRTISSNTDSQITVSSPWTTIPDNTSKFRINDIPTTDVGKFGNAGSFDGIANYNQITSPSDDLILKNGKSLSISAWINPSVLNSNAQHIFNNGWSTLEGYFLRISTSNKIQGKIQDSSGNFTCNNQNGLIGTTTLSVDNWYYVTFTWDATTGESKIFLNGKLEGSCTDNDIKNFTTPQSYIYIGASYAAQTAYFNGLIDELRVYNRALTSGEISQLYNFAPGPIAYYTFEEGSGNTVGDISGNGNTATWNGSGSHWLNGVYGKSGNFNGVNDHIVTNTNIPCSLNQSVSGWFKGSFTGGQRTLFELNGCGGRFLVYFHSSNSIVFYPHNTSAVATSSVFSEDNWHYFTVTTQKINETEVSTKIYIDGILEKDTNVTFSPPSNANKFYIGSVYSHNANFFKGQIDELKVYNYTRTPKQIIEDMNAGHPVGGSPVGSQIGYWKFDEGYGTIAHDSSHQKVDGTLSGSTKPVWSNSGKFGKALSFNGTSSHIALGNISSYKIPDKTVSFWAKPSGNINNTIPILSNGGANWYVGFATGNQMIASFSKKSDGNQRASYSGTNYVIPNEWHQYSYTFSVSGDNVDISFYRDGKLIIKNSYSDGYGTSYGSNFVLGSFTPSTNFYSGLLDEVKIYNSALSAAEIRIDYSGNAGTVMGVRGTDSAGNPSNSASSQYCIPGDTSPCAPPVGEWNFEEGQGSTVNDTSGNNNTGTWNGTGSHWTQGQVGKGGNFNGEDDYTLTNSNPSFYSSPTITVATWIKGDKNGNEQNLYTGILRTLNYKLSVNHAGSNGSFNFRIYSDSGQIGPVNSTTIPQANKWYYVVGVVDETSIKIYVNGKLEGSTSTTETMKTSSTNLMLGKDSDGPDRNFDGTMDQVRIYDYARTPAQIAWDYNKGAPIAHWKLDECQGTTIHSSNDIYDPSLNGTINVRSSGSQTTAGTCNTQGTAWENGKNGKLNSSLNFDGSDDYVSFNTSGIINPPAGAVSLWFNPSANQMYQGVSNYIFSHPQASNNSRIYINTIPSGDKVSCRLGNATIIGDVFISPDNWHHAVCIWNGTSAHFYVDGVDKTSKDSFNGLTSINNNFYLGQISSGGEPFTGQIDDVRIYNYPLTAQQVKQLYNNGAVQYGN